MRASEHDAFISYSHGADARLAPALETGLERLARPFLRLRAMDVFRDRTSLSAQPELWAGILDHLSRSRWLVVLASPALAASRWCTREALWWLENRPRQNLLIALTDGELVWDTQANDFDWQRTTALSPQLRGRFANEPLYVDLRPLREVSSLTLDHPEFRSGVLSLAATIRGMPKDQLDGEDVRQLRRTRRIVRAGVTAIAVSGVAAIVLAVLAVQQRDEARLQARIALSQRVAADARRQPDDRIDRALLLTAAAHSVEPTREAALALLTSLLRTRLQRIETGAQPAAASARTGCAAAPEPAPPPDAAAAAPDPDLANTVCHHRGPDGQRVAAFVPAPAGTTAARFPARLIVWDRVSAARAEVASEHFGPIVALTGTSDGRVLASTDADGVVLLWRRDAGAWRSERLANPSGPLMSLAFDSSGDTLIGGSAGGDRLHWGVRSRQALARVFDDQRVTASGEMGFVRVAFLAGNGLAASNGIDGRVLVWDLDRADATGREILRVTGRVVALTATRNGEWLAAASDTALAVLHVASGRTFTAPTGCRRISGGGLTLSEDGAVLVVGGDNCLRFWRMAATAEPVGLPQPGGRVYAVRLNRDGSALLLGGTFGLVQWHLAGDQRAGEPQQLLPRMLVTKVAVSEEQILIAAGTWRGEVWLVAAGADRPARLLGRHAGGAVLGLAFSPGAGLLASIGTVNAGTLWDVARGEPLVQDLLAAGLGGTTDLAFSQDGRFMAAGSGNRVLSVWPMTGAAWRAKACEIAGRDLSPAEWDAFLPGIPQRPLCNPTAGSGASAASAD